MTDYDLILSRGAYLLSLELRLYWSVAILYSISFLIYIFHGVTGNTSVGRLARWVLWITVVVHIALILLRTGEAGRAPFQTLYETLSWFACSAAITYLLVTERRSYAHLPGLFVTGLSMGACFYALSSRSPAIETLTPALRSYWFEWHVILAFFSYAVFSVSAAIEAACLLLRPLLRAPGTTAYGFTKESLEDLHRMANKLVTFGFPLLTFAVFSGAAWANEAWGRYWSWDPKETWSLITWTVFAVYLHSMTIPSFRGRPASAFNMIGFVCMMMTFLGVNWLAKLLGIPSLHIYAV